MVAETFRHRSARRDAREDADRAEQAERRHRLEARSEEAAIAIIGLLDDARSQYEGCYSHGSGPKDKEQLDSIIRELERQCVHLVDDRVRDSAEIAAEAFGSISILEQWGEGGIPSAIAWKIRQSAREVVGATIRGARPPEDTVLPVLRATIQDYYQTNYPD